MGTLTVIYTQADGRSVIHEIKPGGVKEAKTLAREIIAGGLMIELVEKEFEIILPHKINSINYE